MIKNKILITLIVSIISIGIVGCADKNVHSQNKSASIEEKVYDSEGYDKDGYNREGYKKRELDENGQPLLDKWGLKGEQTESVSNDRDYDWYIDQYSTGLYGNVNCVPTSVTMALKWVNKDYSGTVEELRNEYVNRYDLQSGWINNYALRALRENGAECFLTEYNLTEEKLKNYIKEGNIVLTNLNTGAITYNPNSEERVGHRFDGASDHMLIVKGYKVVDGKLYFELYDPSSAGQKYNDGTYIGVNRYYLGSELIEGINFLNGGFIVVSGAYNDFSKEKGEEVQLTPEMERAVKTDLGIKSGPIYEGDLNRVQEISIVATKVTDFSIIEKMRNLDSIAIVNCGIENINFIKSLKKLRSVCFNMNNISDISVLGKIETIERIEIAENKVKDLSPINDIKNLNYLYIYGNPIDDISILNNRENKIKYIDILM